MKKLKSFTAEQKQTKPMLFKINWIKSTNKV